MNSSLRTKTDAGSYGLCRSTSPMSFAAYTYDSLPANERRALPNEGDVVAALEWAGPTTDSES